MSSALDRWPRQEARLPGRSRRCTAPRPGTVENAVACAYIGENVVVPEWNAYCAALGIPVPRVEDAMRSSDATFYSLLIVALLECGGPLTLENRVSAFAAPPAHSATTHR